MRVFASPFCALLVSGLALLPVSAHANLVVNGDFESGSLGGWISSGAVMAASDSAYIAGAGATGSFPSGHYVAAFGGGNAAATGLITQSFATVIGQQYALTFDYGKFAAGGGPQVIQATVNNVASGATLSSLTVTDASGTNALDSVFSSYSQSFIAVGLLTSLSFRDISSVTASTDGFLDNAAVNAIGIGVNAVPEPATDFLLLMAGVMALLTSRRARLRT